MPPQLYLKVSPFRSGPPANPLYSQVSPLPISFQPINPDDLLDVLEAAEHEAVTSSGLGSSAQTGSMLAASKALGQMLEQEDRGGNSIGKILACGLA